MKYSLGMVRLKMESFVLTMHEISVESFDLNKNNSPLHSLLFDNEAFFYTQMVTTFCIY